MACVKRFVCRENVISIVAFPSFGSFRVKPPEGRTHILLRGLLEQSAVSEMGRKPDNFGPTHFEKCDNLDNQPKVFSISEQFRGEVVLPQWIAKNMISFRWFDQNFHNLRLFWAAKTNRR